jgi:hypothetical protein
MGLGQRFAGLDVETVSRDGLISARVQGLGNSFTVAFRREDAYRRYSSDVLGYQLAQLATLAFVRYQRAKQQIVDSELGAAALHDDGAEFGPERRRYRERLAQITAAGVSGDGRVTVWTRGMVDWQVTIVPGTVARVAEREFLGALTGTVSRLVTRYRAQVVVVRDDIYDFGYPDSFRRVSGIGRRGDARRLP